MRTILLLFLVFFAARPGLSQGFHPEYENDYLGWIKLYKYKGAAKAVQVDEKKYTIAQLSIIDSFANWMQASYMPKGTLGDIIKYVTPKKNLYHERFNTAVPPSFGARAVSYLFLKRSGNKWVPENNLGYGWSIGANEIPLSYRLLDFNTDKVCLFTIPSYNVKVVAEQPGSDEAKEARAYDLSKDPVLGKYLQYAIPNFGPTMRMNMVILAKNNISPFVQITIGEALQYAADALPVRLEEELKKIREANSGNQKEIDRWSAQQRDNFARAKATLEQMNSKYQGQLGEPAFSTYGGYVVSSLQNNYDFFTNVKVDQPGNFDRSYPIYRVKPAVQALCSSDKPQWILVKWYGADLRDAPFRHMHESILGNFDMDHVYNFFFDPEKIKGRSYQPRRSPRFEEKTVTEERSPVAKKAEMDASIFYFEDFSSKPIGQKPNGWRSEMNADADYPAVVQLIGQDEKWMELKGHSNLLPLQLKKPFPQDFELTFDLAVPKDIAWGAKAFELYLGTQSKYDEAVPHLKMRIRAGFYGRPGETSLQGKFGNGFFSNLKPYYEAPGFSNDKEVNRVKISLRKSGETLTYTINNTGIVTLPKAIPAGTGFNSLFLRHISSSGENEKYFITNIKISRL